MTVAGAGNNGVPAIFKTLILRKGAELLEIHEMVHLSRYLIQLSVAHSPLPDSKKLRLGFKAFIIHQGEGDGYTNIDCKEEICVVPTPQRNHD